jgi:nucleotide-binding universal stress UspA family protein
MGSMSTPRLDLHRYRLVVGIDLSEHAEIVLEHALDQVARHRITDLHVIVVREHSKQSVTALKAGVLELVTLAIDAFQLGQDELRARLHVRSGNPADEIVMLAADIMADLIVVGKFGRHARSDDRLGSVATRVLALAPCPTLVVGLTEHEARFAPQCPARRAAQLVRWFSRQRRAAGIDSTHGEGRGFRAS